MESIKSDFDPIQCDRIIARKKNFITFGNVVNGSNDFTLITAVRRYNRWIVTKGAGEF